jgi:bacillithiol biosynthesis cysteine-adding enzyme BshC
MLHYRIPAEKSRLFSPLISDYLERREDLRPFISQWPDAEGFEKQIAVRKKHPVNRSLLQEAFRKQYQGMTLSASLTENIELLSSEDTYTITTGQQIHAFLGPMYVYWKIVSTIALCSQLKKQFSGHHFIPVFWMATEDHDFEEINHLDIFGKRLVWENAPGFSGPVGHRDTTGLLPLLDELDILYTRQPEWKKWSGLFRDAYSRYESFSQATRYLVNEIFGEYGLLVIDPDDATLKRELIPLVCQELKERKSAEAVERTTALLEEKYSRQLSPREINLFYFNGKSRERIEFRDGNYRTVSGAVLCDEASLQEFVSGSIERISTNVVLRPVYQELILPNLAYVGGPGETAYWLQLGGVFSLYNVPFPILENRKSVFVLGKKFNEQLEKSGLIPPELFEDDRELARMLIERSEGAFVSLENELEALHALRTKAIEKIAPVHSSAVRPAAEAFSQIEKLLRKMEKEMFSVQKQGSEKNIDKMLKLKRSLKDEHYTQERNQYVVQYLLLLNHAEMIRFFSENYGETAPVSLIIAG